jgi:hypothetical protein
MVVSFIPSLIIAYPHYKSQIPNGNAFPALGHTNKIDPDANLNQFGRDFAVSANWRQLCMKDSDGEHSVVKYECSIYLVAA